MHSQLLRILREKEREVAHLKKEGIATGWEMNALPVRDFKAAISVPGRISLIAEIKFASPSEGTICKDGDPIEMGHIYEGAGAAAISLLTDKRFFNGDINRLPRLKNAISLPILRKDFIIDAVQVRESLLYGADSVLLLARILSREHLKELLGLCLEFGMAGLTEIHDRDDLEKAVDCGAEIIGINNRDLDTFKVDLKTTLDLAPMIPERCILVSESGISGEGDIRLLKGCGIEAILVGTSLMKTKDLKAKTRELVEAGRIHGKG
jgi:indole-3-glycerol phosphate synthase